MARIAISGRESDGRVVRVCTFTGTEWVEDWKLGPFRTEYLSRSHIGDRSILGLCGVPRTNTWRVSLYTETGVTKMDIPSPEWFHELSLVGTDAIIVQKGNDESIQCWNPLVTAKPKCAPIPDYWFVTRGVSAYSDRVFMPSGMDVVVDSDIPLQLVNIVPSELDCGLTTHIGMHEGSMFVSMSDTLIMRDLRAPLPIILDAEFSQHCSERLSGSGIAITDSGLVVSTSPDRKCMYLTDIRNPQCKYEVSLPDGIGADDRVIVLGNTVPATAQPLCKSRG